ncbi:MAG: permease [Bacilli bacterium]|nr:permease [Bacilli bacterium]
MKHLDKMMQKQWLRGIYVFFILILIAIVLYYVVPLVYPFLFGWVIAYILNPLVNLLHKKAKLPRLLATLISLLVFFALAGLIITTLTINIIGEIGSLSQTIQNNIDSWREQFIQYINSDSIQKIVTQLNTFYQENPQYQNTINANLNSTATTLASIGSSLVTMVFNLMVNFIVSLPRFATLSIIGLLAAFFISKDWYKLLAKAADFFSENTRKATRAIWNDLQKALFGYIRAQLILITITAIVVLIGLIILNVKYAITISVLIGLCDLMPYLGTGTFMIPWIIFLFIQHNLYLGIGLSILYGIILVARQTFEPKVLASSVGLDPLATLIAMFVGLKLFGVLGLVIGPVTLIILTAFHKANVFRDIRNYVMHGSIQDKIQL